MALTLADLVANHTMSADMAVTLAAAAEERRSLLFVAIPRMAGKTTVMRAALQYAPSATPFHVLSARSGRDLGIPETGDGGYLVVAEVSPAGFADYLWGADTRRVFAALARGFSLATALHASGVEEAFEVITRQNGVPDDEAARLDLVVYIRSLGRLSAPQRRVVAAIHEVNAVRSGRPQTILLHRWLEAEDQFEVVERPRRVGAAAVGLERYHREFGLG